MSTGLALDNLDHQTGIMSADHETAGMLNKAGTISMRHVAIGGCYKEGEDPETGKHRVWIDGDTDWGYAPLGAGPEFDAVAAAVSKALKEDDRQGSRNVLSRTAIKAAQAVSQITFPEYDPSTLEAKGLPLIQHGQNTMLVPTGALAVAVVSVPHNSISA